MKKSMTATAYYTAVKQAVLQEQRKTRRLRNGVTTLKIVLFCSMGYFVYLLLTEGTGLPLWGLAAAATAFAGLTVWDGRIVRQLERQKTRMDCCDMETDYLIGKTDRLDRGERYADPSHAFSSDLDLFGDQSLFQALNRTSFSEADDLLAEWLLTPCLSRETIRQRQEAAGALAAVPDRMLDFRVAGSMHRLTPEEAATIRTWHEEEHRFLSRRAVGSLYSLNIVSATVWILVLCGIWPVGAGLTAFIVQLGIVGAYTTRTNRIYGKTDRFLKASEKVMRMVEIMERLPAGPQKLAELRDKISGETDALAAMRVLQRVMNGFDQRNNILAAIILNGLYMKELHHLIALGRWCRKYDASMPQWMAAVRETDVLVSMGTYRFNHPDYRLPEFGEEALLQAEEAAHPLLRAEKNVGNDLTVRELHDIYIVTGANMAGKSTFLRTVGVNLVLALSGNPVCARRFVFQPMELFTSMRTTDNLARGTSYFHAELLRLKALTEAAERSGKLFFILDEMLKGTNSRDKLNGSLRFLERLLRLPVAGLAATHDLELGKLAERYPDRFRNVCFEITHEEGGQIHYDYRLRPGISRNMNASVLLEQMGLI